jgi:hypothetical protein
VSKAPLFERVNQFLEKDMKVWPIMGMIEELLKAGEEYKQENELMAEKHAEKDIAITQFIMDLEKANGRIKDLETLLNHYTKTAEFWFAKAQELKPGYFDLDDQY